MCKKKKKKTTVSENRTTKETDLVKRTEKMDWLKLDSKRNWVTVSNSGELNNKGSWEIYEII